jgi:SAM-dependent methyltransferase
MQSYFNASPERVAPAAHFDNPLRQGGVIDMACPLCGDVGTTPCYRVESAPVTCASLFGTPAAAQAVPRGVIDLQACRRCGLVFNAAFNTTQAEIGAQYESSQGASGHFSDYARWLAAHWVTSWNLAGKTVIEIGCGSGEFLTELLRLGVATGVGVDPLADAERCQAEFAGRLRFLPAHFDDEHLELEGDALVCRHTLEHIADVHGFLQLVAAWASRKPNRVVLFEVPASERIFSQCAFWDIYYEHCNYFTQDSLERAFAWAGFEVHSVQCVYGSQYLLLEACASRKQNRAAQFPALSADTSDVLTFGTRAGASISRARKALRELAQDGPLAIWQGASKTVGFLSALGDSALVQCAFDLNPQRHDRYLPGIGTQVVSPDAIGRLQPRHIVLMNPVYYAEVEALLRARNSHARLYTVDQLCQSQDCSVRLS